jgi:membrane-associated phospholipid phosphatase
LRNATATAPQPNHWIPAALGRIRHLWPLKMFGSMACMAAFFAAYFWILNHPLHPLTTVPRIALDGLVPFWPGALGLYVSLWVYVPLAPALLETRRGLGAYVLAAAALSATGFAVFLLWPTTVPRPDAGAAPAASLAYLEAVDASGNAFPSLHVAFAVFSALWLGRLLKGLGAGPAARALNWAWCAGIVFSTVAIRQHVVLDALAGGVLGAGAAWLHMRAAGDGPS